MEIKEPFIKVSAPQSQLQLSPRKQDAVHSSRNEELAELQEIRIGNYYVKAQRISEHSIDGYAAVFDENKNILFEGQYARSKKNGFGIQFNSKGGIAYEGNFRDDKYDGWGRTNCYSGQFRDGLYDGYGIYSNNNVYYEGFFNRGLYSGQGIYFTGEKMTSFHPVKNINTFLTDGLKNNLDIMEKHTIDEIYIGEWKQGNKHGFGRLWKKDYWYAGQFSNNLPHGFGAQQDKVTKKVKQTKYKLGVKWGE